MVFQLKNKFFLDYYHVRKLLVYYYFLFGSVVMGKWFYYWGMCQKVTHENKKKNMIGFVMYDPGHDMDIFRSSCSYWGNTPEALITLH